MSQNRPRIAAGIVLYNPDLVRLQENILAIKDQVDLIILIENGSIKTEYLQQFDSSDIVLLINETNKGIAFALNQICHYCYCHKIPWVLTLDPVFLPLFF